jgi:N-acetylmuramoyl-L-alanine amidase
LPRLPHAFAMSSALLAAVLLQAQGSPPPAPLVMITRDARRPVPTILINNQEMIALDEVARLFQATFREDALAGGVTVTYKGRSVVVSTEQPMASVGGRVVSLPSPSIRVGARSFVPVEFLSRAFGMIYDARIELRRSSRLLIVGDPRVPRVVARVDSPGPPTRATIDISPATSVTVTTEAARILAKIDADALDLSVPSLPASGLIDQIRGLDAATVVVGLRSGSGTPRATTTTTETGTRVSIEIPPAETPETTADPVPPLSAPADPLPPFATPRAALQTIVIDPGHGGEENGATGAGGTLEKQVALELARRAKTLIETRLGVRVVLTREDDRTMRLDERSALANNTKADLFISLHAGAALGPSVSGAEVFHLGLDPDVEEARRSAEADSLALPVLGGSARAIDVIRWDMAQAAHIESSTVLASILEEELRSHVPMGPRPIQQAPMRVLMGTNMPAALVEVAYLTNAEQEKQVSTPQFQQSITLAIYESVLRFRSHLESRR